MFCKYQCNKYNIIFNFIDIYSFSSVSGCVGMGMLDDLPFINEATVKLDKPSKLFCYTDGLVEVIQDSGIEFGTENLEKEISNPKPLEENIKTIIDNQKIMEGSAAIFDDISINAVN